MSRSMQQADVFILSTVKTDMFLSSESEPRALYMGMKLQRHSSAILWEKNRVYLLSVTFLRISCESICERRNLKRHSSAALSSNTWLETDSMESRLCRMSRVTYR